MSKFLQAVRLDDSDAMLYQREGAADDGEWLTSGGFAVCDIASGEHFYPSCRCDSSFVALATGRRATIAEVVDVTDMEIEELVQTMARYLIERLNAPSREAALRVAGEEIRYTAELCETFSTGVWITVVRTLNDTGDAVTERYRVHERLQVGAHKL